MNPELKTVLVTGGAGYVGAVLVPRLVKAGYRVKVVDLYLYGDDVLSAARGPKLEEIRGDIRDQALLRKSLKGVDAVIHLACISNDPSFELDCELGRSINFDAFAPLVQISRDSGVRRFIYASTSSVYGVSEAPEVTEEHPLKPLTDYSKYKALCEPLLLESQEAGFTTVIIRPATVCGYSPRQRLDLTVNILTNNAVNTGKITVFGGTQMRSSIHIEDMAELYERLLELPAEKIAGKTFNAGAENHTVADIALQVAEVVRARVPGRDKLEIVTTPSDDNRSYHICSERIRRDLGYLPTRGIRDAVEDLIAAFRDGRLPDSMHAVRYFNIKTMQAANLR